MINIFSGSSLGKISLCKVLSLQDMCECICVIMLCHCHREITPFNIVSVLLNIIFKHKLKKTLWNFVLLYENYCKVVKEVRNFLELF